MCLSGKCCHYLSVKSILVIPAKIKQVSAYANQSNIVLVGVDAVGVNIHNLPFLLDHYIHISVYLAPPGYSTPSDPQEAK